MSSTTLPRVVIDACVAGAWSFSEVHTQAAIPVLDALQHTRILALAPDRFEQELMRVCQKKTLPPPIGASIAPADAWARFLDVVTSRIEFVPSAGLEERAWDLAMATPRLTTHDALYLAVSEARAAELWTLDSVLAAGSPACQVVVMDLRTTPFPY